MLIVADSKDMPMVAADVANHRVLDRIQILKLVDEDAVPPRANALHDLTLGEQLGGLEHQHVEVDEVAFVEEGLIPAEDFAVTRILERRAAKAVRGEAREKPAVPAGRNGEPAQDDARAELAKQLGAESVNGARLDVGRMAA